MPYVDDWQPQDVHPAWLAAEEAEADRRMTTDQLPAPDDQPSNAPWRGVPPEPKGDGTLRCSQCNGVKPAEDFAVDWDRDSKGNRYGAGLCRMCWENRDTASRL